MLSRPRLPYSIAAFTLTLTLIGCSDEEEATTPTCQSDDECTIDLQYCLGDDGSKTRRICRGPTNCGEVPSSTRASYCRIILGAGNQEVVCALGDGSGAEPECQLVGQAAKLGEACTESVGCEGALICSPETKLCVEETTTDGCSSCPLVGGFEQSCEQDTCVPPSFVSVAIRDVTPGGDSCNGNDPGSDLMTVRLLGAQDEVLGYGSLVDSAPILTAADGADNQYIASTRFNGSELDIPPGSTCPPFVEVGGGGGQPSTPRPQTFDEIGPLSLGCGGSARFEFLDRLGNVIPIEAGMRIEVHEFGLECGGQDSDQYAVSVCTKEFVEDGAGVPIDGGEDVRCDVSIGASYSGAAFVDVAKTQAF